MLSWFVNHVTPSLEVQHVPRDDAGRLIKATLRLEPVLSGAEEREYRLNIEQICRLSFDIETRQMVMNSLHYALSPNYVGVEWRMIFNGLRILNSLIDGGSVEIFKEVSEGKHFDILQKSLFLLSFSHADERVTKVIRSSAREVRDRLLVKFNEIEENYNMDQHCPFSSTGISSDDIRANGLTLSTNPVSHLVSFGHVESDDEERLDTPALPDLL